MKPAAGGATLLGSMPVVFVLIWSTGFVVARYAMPHAAPMGFLALRFALSVLVFLAWVRLVRVAWPRERAQWLHLAMVGVLMHVGYLGGVWAAVKIGLGAGLASLIVGLQPMLTALWVSRAGSGSSATHRLSAQQWWGLLLGLLGLLLVLWRKLDAGEAPATGVALAVLALASITASTLYQKRWVAPCDVRSANAVQLAAALAVTAPLAWFEGGRFDWQPELVGAMAWSVLVMTLGGSSLLYLLIQRGAATRVASLMYLVPPCTALLAWLLFGEALTPLVWAGLVCAAAGVALVVRAPAAAR